MAVRRGGATTAELATGCSLNRATAWRILSTLEDQGLVAHDVEGGGWTLGRGVVDLVQAAGMDELVLEGGHDGLRDVAGVLHDVAMHTGETAALAVRRGHELTYVDEAAPTALVAVSWAGRPVSLHATSTGKVLLAWSPAADVDRWLEGTLERFTSSTITDPVLLAADLDATRARGWATCAGEYDESAWGVSCPVLDPQGRLCAVLSIWGPPPRITTDRFAALAEVAREAAARVAPGAPLSR